MDTELAKELRAASKTEKDPQVMFRIAAVNAVCVRGEDVGSTAKLLMRTPNCIRQWISRFEEGGIDALRDHSRSGRPPKVKPEIISEIIDDAHDGVITPRILAVEIRDRTGVQYHPSSARRLMREQNMSPKTPELVHKSKADVDTIRRWQRNAKRHISRLEREGFTTVIQDESIFVDAPIVGRKYWSAVGTPITVTYRGNRRRTVAYGAIATDGRRFFRTYDKFDGPTFLRYLKELRSHFGKVPVIMDGASAHTTRDVKKFVADNPDTVRVRYLPVATPELSGMEEYWHRAKRDVLVSEYYATFEEMRHALSEYLRTTSFADDIMEYLGTKSPI